MIVAHVTLNEPCFRSPIFTKGALVQRDVQMVFGDVPGKGMDGLIG